MSGCIQLKVIRYILNRITVAVDDTSRLHQARFRKQDAHVAHAMLCAVLIQIIENATSLNSGLLLNFIDFKKHLIVYIGLLLNFIDFKKHLIVYIDHQFGKYGSAMEFQKAHYYYKDSRCTVRADGKMGDWFKIVTGVR